MCLCVLTLLSALEINIKLCEPDFARKAKTADFIGQTWDLLREGGAGKGEDKASDWYVLYP